ncbi:MAG: FAD-dependent oxidoreductase [Oscillospiraceae bacterium]|nr:FAD-dependent oxidoreductase [Oscillospiraceae bacterium]
MHILENLQTEVTKQCDVLVCGGGFAGISAALSAARAGKKVILLEKTYMLGGLATAGLVTIYLPLCDGEGRQVSFGIAEELLRLSCSMGSEARYPANWLDSDDPSKRTRADRRFEVQFNAQLFAILAEQLLQKENVEILYGFYAVGTHKAGDKIDAVIVENKTGRQAIGVKSVVDATGDCDIAHIAEAPTDTFKQGNVLAAWYYSVGAEGYKLHCLGACDTPDEEKKPGRVGQYLVNRRFTGLDGVELSEQMQLSHASIMNDLKKNRAEDPTMMPCTIATIPQIRMTRKIVGLYEMTLEDDKKYIEDSIGMVCNWKKRGPVYEVPFRALYSPKVKNLICAGRCICSTESMWDVMRVIPCCAVTGQAAGLAAAMTDDFNTLDVTCLQAELQRNGVVLHERELG